MPPLTEPPSSSPGEYQKRKTNPSRNSRWFNTLLVVVIVLVFITASMAFFPSRVDNAPTDQPTLVPTITAAAQQPTSLPEEILQNREQTNGIVFGGVILVLIIVVGTLSVISKKPSRR